MSARKFVLEAREFRLSLDQQGHLYQLESPFTMKEGLFKPGAQPPCFGWFLEINGKKSPARRISFTSPSFSNQAATLNGSNKSVSVEITVGIDRLGPNWVMRLGNHGSKTITGVTFQLANQYTFDAPFHVTFPYCAGWELPLSEMEQEESFSLDYPVKASMQWTSVYSRREGVYFGIHDSVPLYKELFIDHQSIQWKFSHLELQPGEQKELPPVYLIPHGNGWRGGAQYYQSWVKEQVQLPDTPAWYVKKPTWAWVGLRGQHEEVAWHDTAYLPKVSSLVAGAGIDLVQLTAYTEQGHDTLYPDYEPGPSIGGADGLRQAVDEIHRQGRRISIYTNGRLIDPASSVPISDRQLWGVRASPGAGVFTEQYGKVSFDVMCPGAAGWRSLFIEKLEYLVKTFDIDGIYIDQVSGCRSLPCYATNHDHPKPNEAWSYYQPFISELRKRLKSIKPDIFLATEGVNDFFGQFFDSQQAHNDWTTLTHNRGIPLPDLFHATIPGQILNVGCITQESSGPYYLKLAHASGQGCDFGVWDWNEMHVDFYRKAKTVIEWHTEHADTFRFGEVIPLEDSTTRSEWKVNAYYRPSQILINAAWLGETSQYHYQPGCSVLVPLPIGSAISDLRICSGFLASPCRYILQAGGLSIHIEAGSGELAGVAVDLGKKESPDKAYAE